jgi:hypothetical protein
MGGFVKEHPDKLDSDHDAAISEAEFLREVRRMFDKLDFNRDGNLSAAEWRDLPAGVPAPQDGPEYSSRESLPSLFWSYPANVRLASPSNSAEEITESLLVSNSAPCTWIHGFLGPFPGSGLRCGPVFPLRAAGGRSPPLGGTPPRAAASTSFTTPSRPF